MLKHNLDLQFTLRKYFSNVKDSMVVLDMASEDEYNSLLLSRYLCGHSESKIIRVEGNVNEISTPVNFIYVDEDVYEEDLIYVHGLLVVGGIILFNKYSGIVQTFILMYRHEYHVVFIGSQLCVKKNEKVILGSYDVYTLCYNEERLIRKFLHHYSGARKIVILDNESTDNSVKYALETRPEGLEIISFSTGKTLNDTIQSDLKNSIWYESKGKVNYVIVQDLDEFVNNLDMLKKLDEKMISSSNVWAWNIIATDDEFAKVPEADPTKYLRQGQKCPDNYDKPLIFNPNLIYKTKFAAGQHTWDPVGILNHNTPENMPLMLHYKYIGKQWSLARFKHIRDRMSQMNKEKGHGIQYLSDVKAVEKSLVDLYNGRIDITGVIYRNMVPVHDGKFYIYNDDKIDAISTAVKKGDIWEPKITEIITYLCNQNLNTTFIDIGANIGIHSLNAMVGGAKHIHAFECNPTTFRLLQQNIDVNCSNKYIPYTLYQKAVSDKNDEFYDFFEVPGNIGASYVTSCPLNNGNKIDEKVQSITIDSIDQITSIDNNILVKMDVEGHELPALRGMTKLLNNPNLKSIIIEMNSSTSSYDDLVTIYNLIKSSGFNHFRILFATSQDPWSGPPSELLPKQIKNWNMATNILLSVYDEITEKDLLDHFKSDIIEVIFFR